MSNDSARWLKDCEVCNAGLCSYIDELTTKKDLTVREAARRMEKESEGLYSAAAIRARYNYIKNPNYKRGGISTTPKTAPSKTAPMVQDSDNLFQLKLYWRRATKKDRKKFVALLKGNQEIDSSIERQLRTELNKPHKEARSFLQGDSLESIINDRFKQIFKELIGEIHNEREMGWKTTTKQAVLKQLKMINDILRIGG